MWVPGVVFGAFVFFFAVLNLGSLTTWIALPCRLFDVRVDETMRESNQPLERDFLLDGEFDPGSERTLAAWFRHASRANYLD